MIVKKQQAEKVFFCMWEPTVHPVTLANCQRINYFSDHGNLLV